MFLIDTSVWIAQAFSAHPDHAAARAALDPATRDRPAAFCRATEQSFLRLVSTPAVQQRYGMMGITNEDALAMLEKMLALPGVAFRAEPEAIAPLWHELARRRTASPKVWMDAYLAAFAIAAGLTMISLDADFRKYEPMGLSLQLLKT